MGRNYPGGNGWGEIAQWELSRKLFQVAAVAIVSGRLFGLRYAKPGRLSMCGLDNSLEFPGGGNCTTIFMLMCTTPGLQKQGSTNGQIKAHSYNIYFLGSVILKGIFDYGCQACRDSSQSHFHTTDHISATKLTTVPHGSYFHDIYQILFVTPRVQWLSLSSVLNGFKESLSEFHGKTICHTFSQYALSASQNKVDCNNTSQYHVLQMEMVSHHLL